MTEYEWLRSALDEASEAAWDAETEDSLALTAGADALIFKSFDMLPEQRATWGVDLEGWVKRGTPELPSAPQAKAPTNKEFGAMCNHCEQMSRVAASDLRILQYPEGFAYSFFCQHCSTTAVRPCDARILHLLTEAGVEVTEEGGRA